MTSVQQIREDSKTGVYVEALTEEYVSNLDDVTRLLVRVWFRVPFKFPPSALYSYHVVRQDIKGLW